MSQYMECNQNCIWQRVRHDWATELNWTDALPSILYSFSHSILNRSSMRYTLLLSSGHGEGNGTPLQYCCLENSLDRGAWLATVHGVLKSQAWLRDWACTHTHTHTQRIQLKRNFVQFLAMVASEICLEIFMSITEDRRLNDFCFVSYVKGLKLGKKCKP